MISSEDRTVYVNFLDGTLGIDEFWNYLAHKCNFGNRAGYNHDLWGHLDEIIGYASFEQGEIDEVQLEIFRTRVKDLCELHGNGQ